MSVRLWMMNMKAAGLRGHASHRNGESHTVSKPHFFPFVSQPVRPVEETRSSRSNRSTHRLSAAQNAEVSVRRQQTRRGVPGGSASVPLSAATFDATLKALCESKQYGKAWNLYMKHSGDWMQHLSYNSLQALLSQSLRNGNLAAAVTVFEDMKSAGYRPNKVTFSMLISGLCKQRRKGSSGFKELGYTYWKELERNHGSRLDAAALRNGMQACVGVGKLDEAEAILDTIEVLVVTSKNESSEQRRRREGAQGAQGARRGGDRKDDRNDTGDRNDVRTYNILINGFAKERNSAGIEALFKRMLAANVRPTITTYNALVSSHVKSGRMDEAVRTVERARNAGIAPDAWTFTSLMKGHINAEDFAAAKTVWRDMIAAGVKPTPVSYSVMIDCAIQEGDMAQAQRLLDIMHAQGERPSAITFNALLRAYVVSAELRSFDASDDGIANFGTANFTNTSRIPEALRVLDQMEEANVLPATDTSGSRAKHPAAGRKVALARITATAPRKPSRVKLFEGQLPPLFPFSATTFSSSPHCLSSAASRSLASESTGDPLSSSFLSSSGQSTGESLVSGSEASRGAQSFFLLFSLWLSPPPFPPFPPLSARSQRARATTSPTPEAFTISPIEGCSAASTAVTARSPGMVMIACVVGDLSGGGGGGEEDERGVERTKEVERRRNSTSTSSSPRPFR